MLTDKVYTGKLATRDPFMSEREFIENYKNLRKTKPSKEELASAKKQYRQGYRYDGHWFRPPHLVRPHDPHITEDEILAMWRRGTGKSRMSEDKAKKKIGNSALVL